MPAKEPLPRRPVRRSLGVVGSPTAETGALKKFGDNLRARREAQDLSQEQRAERADPDLNQLAS